jgi:hypothetical protein
MNIKFFARFLTLCFSAAVLAVAQRAQATLGESVDSVAKDRTALSAVQRSAKILSGYTVHEVESDSTSVREYSSPSGVVFGIAWNGLIHPDLNQLLGSYGNDYREGLQKTPRHPGRRHHQVNTERVVVEKWGHMRNLQGRAYAPSLIPPGVRVDEIK